ncbi:MAG: ABC transporter substrate-binding protein [Actinomycetota bacterium]|jgi:peptide/nickel transport system substrate-binding protein|nr:ABC transporter substrate-binding protein [Actinomycetota bacterium]
MNKASRSLALLASGATVALGLAVAPVTSASASSIRYGGVLKYVSSWTTIPDNFNPLNPAGTGGTAGGTGSLLYEPLIYENVYTGKATDLLATGYKWSNGNKTLTLTTRTGVKWSDGQPFSAADVAFTFNYVKKYPALDVNGFWKSALASVTATGPNTVVFQFRSPQTSLFPQIVGQEIVPQHVWSKVSNPVTFANPHPVGTGPFLLESYSNTQVSYVKNPHYWMPGRPYLAGVTMQAVKSNATAQLLVMNGAASFTYDAITDPGRSFVAHNKAFNHYWWPVTNLNLLYLNNGAAPFNDAFFRKALAMTINVNAVAVRAYFGAIPAASGALRASVTPGQVHDWVPTSVSSLGWQYNPSGAVKLLESHGYKLSGGSLQAPDGKPLPTFNILVGAGWSDFISMAQTIGQELLPLGIHTTVEQEPYSTYASSANYGRYSMMISWGNNANVTPYYMYYYLFHPNNSAPIGKFASTNWERYTSPAVTSALNAYARTTNLAIQKSAMATIEKEVLQNVPVIPLTGRPNFLDYSTRSFVGWPGPSNPYNSGDPGDGFGGGGEMTYLNVHLK